MCYVFSLKRQLAWLLKKYTQIKIQKLLSCLFKTSLTKHLSQNVFFFTISRKKLDSPVSAQQSLFFVVNTMKQLPCLAFALRSFLSSSILHPFFQQEAAEVWLRWSFTFGSCSCSLICLELSCTGHS